MPIVSTSLVLARPGTPTRRPWPPESTVISARSITCSWPKITFVMPSRAARTWAAVASALRTIISSSFSIFSPVATAIFFPCRALTDQKARHATCNNRAAATFDPRRFWLVYPCKSYAIFRAGCVESRRCEQARTLDWQGKQWRRRGRAGLTDWWHRCPAMAARACRRSICGIPHSAAISTCASPQTAPGSTWARRSAVRPWCGSLPPSLSAKANITSS